MKKFLKPILIAFGLIFFTVGMIGIFVPGLPTTIFMILAAYCFIRSSEKLYKMVISNKIFGYKVRHFIETKTIPLRGKIHSISAMWIFGLLSLYLTNASLVTIIIVVGLVIIGTIVVLSFPTSQDYNNCDK